MSPEEAKAYYKNREFFEIIIQKDGTRLLEGPIDTIRKAVPSYKGDKGTDNTIYGYVQLINGQIVRAFRQDEIAERLNNE